jgi:hypothetical protein
LLRLLVQRKLDEGERGLWYRWFDWLLPLSEKLNRRVWAEFTQQTAEGAMPFVTFAEKFGHEKGIKEGLLEGIEAMLEIKFGSAGLEMLPELKGVEDVALLRQVVASLKQGGGVEDVRRLLPPPRPSGPS